jgi:hypothetical protein
MKVYRAFVHAAVSNQYDLQTVMSKMNCSHDCRSLARRYNGSHYVRVKPRKMIGEA